MTTIDHDLAERIRFAFEMLLRQSERITRDTLQRFMPPYRALCWLSYQLTRMAAAP